MGFESAPGASSDDASRKAAETAAQAAAAKAKETTDMELKAEEAMRDPRNELHQERYDFAFHERESTQDRERAAKELMDMGLSMEDIRDAVFSYEWRDDIRENVMVGNVGGKAIRAWHEGAWGESDGRYRATVDGQDLEQEDAKKQYSMLYKIGVTQKKMPEGKKAKDLIDWAKEKGKI